MAVPVNTAGNLAAASILGVLVIVWYWFSLQQASAPASTHRALVSFADRDRWWRDEAPTAVTTLFRSEEPPYNESEALIPPLGSVCSERRAVTNNSITFYVQNPRTGSLFLGGKLWKYGSGKYSYHAIRIKNMHPRLTKNLEAFTEEVCRTTPGFKVFVWDTGATPNWILQNWPDHSLLLLTGDESGVWGLKARGRHWGPFGDGDEIYFKSNSSSEWDHILLPRGLRPWFRQYCDTKQVAAFGHDSFVYVPLGSRSEFPEIQPDEIRPASERKYTCSVMAGATDASRRVLFQALEDDQRIPAEKKFLHLSKWHPELTNEEYIPPERYREILLQTIFAPCPKGQSLETYRLYEVLEAGAIPIIDLAHGEARTLLPPEYFDAPMVFVESWSAVVDVMLELLHDPVALDARQAALRDWYQAYMRGFVQRLEDVLESRRRPYPMAANRL
eukprot:m.138036 g.138036  ORF g.138036 m.138036 type:complete len:445 (+) comp9943_c0_seq5:175-1509(+)